MVPLKSWLAGAGWYLTDYSAAISSAQKYAMHRVLFIVLEAPSSSTILLNLVANQRFSELDVSSYCCGWDRSSTGRFRERRNRDTRPPSRGHQPSHRSVLPLKLKRELIFRPLNGCPTPWLSFAARWKLRTLLWQIQRLLLAQPTYFLLINVN